MTVNTPGRGRGKTVGAFDRVANISMKDDQEAVKSNIRVVVRVRPDNKQELQGGYGTAVRVLDDRLLIFDPKEDEVPDYYHGRPRKGRDFCKKKNRDMRFAFDYVFDTEATNEDVYNNTTKGVLDSLLNGFNCSVFAYGATGAGKTYTMKGTMQSPGVMFITTMDLYQRIEQIKEEKTCDVAVSYLEVYNEQIKDLLNPGGYLPVREDPQKGAIVSGLSLHKPRNAEELLHMLDFGNKNRSQHPTDANAESSRSHAVFQVFVRQKERTANVSADVSVAKMSLIDLAGSERATVTKNCGARFREGANINRSLLALGNCINALADGKSKGYIPYRDSKLTRLLKDSLGGNCRTVMIAALSPSTMAYEDTYNTLKYADRAKSIKANLKRNVVSVDYHISHYAKMIEDLRAELEVYKVKVKGYEEGAVVSNKTPLDSPYNEEIERIQGVMFCVFQDRMNIRKEIMELEGSERDLDYRIHVKEQYLNRIGVVFTDPIITEKVTSKIQRSIFAAKKRQVNMGSRKVATQVRMDSNVTELHRVEGEMKMVSHDGVMPEILELTLRTRHLEVELRDTKRQVKYLKKLCRAQEREAQATERLVKSLLEGFKKQYYLLKDCQRATVDIDADYESVKQMLFGEREVAWADQSIHEGVLPGGIDVPESVRKPSNSDGYDINKLVDFPVLACVNTTPRTPVNNGKFQVKTPKSNNRRLSAAMTPCTPGSYKKGRFTPRRQSMPVFQMMTPNTPRLSGSHQLLNTTSSSVNSSTESTNISLSHNTNHDTLGNMSRSSAMNSIDENCEIDGINNETVVLRMGSVLVGSSQQPELRLGSGVGFNDTRHNHADAGIQVKNQHHHHHTYQSGATGNGSSVDYVNNQNHLKYTSHTVVNSHPAGQGTRVGIQQQQQDSISSNGVRNYNDNVTNGASPAMKCSVKDNKGGELYGPNTPRIVSGSKEITSSGCSNRLNSTFTFDGIEPLPESPLVSSSVEVKCTASSSNNVLQSSRNAPIQSLFGGNAKKDSGDNSNSYHNNAGQSMQHTQQQYLSNNQTQIIVRNAANSNNQQTEVNGRNQLHISNTNKGGSNEKARPQQGTISKPVPKRRSADFGYKAHEQARKNSNEKKATMNVTVTKTKSSFSPGNSGSDGKENQPHHSSVVRSMTFENMPSPAGKLTFAQALKSPSVKLLRQSGVAPFSPRSPLCSRENLPMYQNTDSHNGARRVAKRHLPGKEIPKLSYKDPVLTSTDIALAKTVSDLRRMGLPSVRQRAQSASRVPAANGGDHNNGNKPSYMRMTSAAQSRNAGNHFQRTNPTEAGSTSEEKPDGSKRTKKDDTRKPLRQIGRSQSMKVISSAASGRKWNRF